MNARAAYVKFEVLRIMRNPRFLIFSFIFPVVLFAAIAGPHRNNHNYGGSGVDALVFYLVGIGSWGAMGAMMNSGGRIAAERSVGWNRQLRITPLTPFDYLIGKLVVAYTMALATLLLLTGMSVVMGARFDVVRLVEMITLVLIGVIPFALLAIALGHALTPDTIGPAIGGVMGLLPLVSGTWYPIGKTGFLHEFALVLPSYWLVQAGTIAVGGPGWTARGWITMIIWTVVFLRLAMVSYRRDTARS